MIEIMIWHFGLNGVSDWSVYCTERNVLIMCAQRRHVHLQGLFLIFAVVRTLQSK